jgi:hypothetical protein
VRAQHRPAAPEADIAGPGLDAIEAFPGLINTMLEAHRPSRMPFFARLGRDAPLIGRRAVFPRPDTFDLPIGNACNPRSGLLPPHLDSPALRKRKLSIFVDDDGLPRGETHHYQLSRAFGNIGARCLLKDEEFGDPDEPSRHLEGKQRISCALHGRFIPDRSVPGAVETLSVDWMRALAGA